MNVILCQPTDTSITASFVSDKDVPDVLLKYGTNEPLSSQTPSIDLVGHIPKEIHITGLTPNTQYFYRTCVQGMMGEMETFHTQRARGTHFTFTITTSPYSSDMHNESLFRTTLHNVVADEPDFHIEIGDVQETKQTLDEQFANHRKLINCVACTAPVFRVSGQQECGWSLDGTADNVAVCTTNARKKYFPQPENGDFYSGNATNEPFIGSRQDYYCWSWGNAAFFVLTPWWTTADNPEITQDLWDWTIGADQYMWLKEHLCASTDKFKFVFVQHVLGSVKGGRKWTTQYEWGSANERPWQDSIHALFVANNVTAVFQGNDNVYVKQDVDGIVYQTCPMPADDQYRLLNSSEFDGGVKRPNSGHIRVSVSDVVDVEYVSASLPGDGENRQLMHAYVAQALCIEEIEPQEAVDVIEIMGAGFGDGIESSVHFGNCTYNYPHVRILSWTDTLIKTRIPVYPRNRFGNEPFFTRDVWVTVGSLHSREFVLMICEEE